MCNPENHRWSSIIQYVSPVFLYKEELKHYPHFSYLIHSLRHPYPGGSGVNQERKKETRPMLFSPPKQPVQCIAWSAESFSPLSYYKFDKEQIQFNQPSSQRFFSVNTTTLRLSEISQVGCVSCQKLLTLVILNGIVLLHQVSRVNENVSERLHKVTSMNITPQPQSFFQENQTKIQIQNAKFLQVHNLQITCKEI